MTSTGIEKVRLGGLVASVTCVCLALVLGGCAAGGTSSSSFGITSGGVTTTSSSTGALSSRGDVPTKDDITINDNIANSADGEHAVEADGTNDSYSNVLVQKTGDSDSGDEADFYGDNAAIFATNEATLTLSELVLESDGTHANGVFSYGEGTTVNVSDSVIETAGNCSGGLMTTGGGTMNAANLRITTSGNSSAAIRSDRGGGTVNVDGGLYTTSGTGSPVIYSTADITVSDASLESTASQGVVVEGKNSVTLNDVELVADNNTHNSDKSDYYEAVMIYQSMSGDAANGEASFNMDGGSIDNANGDVFFVNNTVAIIELSGVEITNNGDGVFLRAAAAGWGKEGSNGGQVTLNAAGQNIVGDMVVDDVSSLNLYLDTGSSFQGAVNAEGQAGEVYVELSGGSTWTLTGDSYISGLTCDVDAIDLNGYALYVDGEAYVEGSASTGDPIAVTVSDVAGGPGEGDMPGTPPDGSKGDGPGGIPPSGGKPGGTSRPPSKPSAN